MSRLEVTENFGVADFGYDFYLLAIAKLLHGQYFRLLDFYFHTLIQQRRYGLKWEGQPYNISLYFVKYSNSWSYEVQWKANRQIIELTSFL